MVSAGGHFKLADHVANELTKNHSFGMQCV